MRAVGIDVGARTLHAVALDGSHAEFPATALGAVVEFCAGADSVAIDAPASLSTAPHLDDTDVNRKFRIGRCGEIAAGQRYGVWVPWVTPVTDPPSWMVTGFALWEALVAAGHDPMEVYPAGCFWLLNGRRWPPNKATPAGRAARIALLDFGHHINGDDIAMWSHHFIDAAMAAVVAGQGRTGALAAGHDGPRCDGSALWLASGG